MTTRVPDKWEPVRTSDIKRAGQSDIPEYGFDHGTGVPHDQRTKNYVAPTDPAQADDLYTVTDFENNPRNIERMDLLSEYFKDKKHLWDFGAWGGNDDISEFMRDRVIRLSTLYSDAKILEDAPSNIKSAYMDLKEDFDRANITGVGEHAEMVKDYVTDLLASPEMAATALAAVGSLFTGGTTGGALTATYAAARAAAQQAATKGLAGRLGTGTFKTTITTGPGSEIAKRGLAKAVDIAKKPATFGAAYGSIEGGAAQTLQQKVEIAADARTDYNYNRIALDTIAGGTIGYGLTKGAGWAGGKINAWWNKSDLEQQAEVEQFTLDLDEPNENIAAESLAVAWDADSQIGLPLEDVGGTQEALDLGKPRIRLPAQMGPEINEATQKAFDELQELINDPNVSEAVLQDSQAFQDYIEIIGGSQEQQDKILSDLLAAAGKKTEGNRLNAIRFALTRPFATFISKFAFGKATAFLSPYMDVSPHATVLANRITKEYQIGWTKGQEIVTEDLSEAQHKIYGNLAYEFLRINEDLLEVQKREWIPSLKYTHEDVMGLPDQINNELILAMRGQPSKGKSFSKEVNVAATRMKLLYSNIGDLLEEAKPDFKKIPDYIPREWSRSAIENNREGLAKLLVRDEQAPDMKSAYKLVEEMLDIQNHATPAGNQGSFFLNKRSFNELESDADYQEFLNSDVKLGFMRYIEGASNILAQKRILGVTDAKSFNDVWISRIEGDMRKQGRKLSDSEKARLMDLYNGLTGTGLSPSGLGSDGYGLTNRLALLGFATPSSITEIFLNLGQMKSDKAVKGFRDAFNTNFKKMTDDQHKDLVDNWGLTPKEAWLELQRFGLDMEVALSTMTDRLAGEAIGNPELQKVSNQFFRANMLDQWTRFNQATAFISGKNMILDYVTTVAQHGDAPISKHVQIAKDRLADLGIDSTEAVRWLQEGKNTKSNWYVSNILNGAARYSRNIILDVSRSAGVKPRAMTSGVGLGIFKQTTRPIFGQLMGYPTAFTNTILKGAAKQMMRDRGEAAARLIPTALLLTTVAGFANYVRDRGEGWEDKEPIDMAIQAAARWGGQSVIGDVAIRGMNSAMYLNNPMALPASIAGPIGTDMLQLADGKVATIASQKVPLYSLGKTIFGAEAMRNYRRAARKIDSEIFGAVVDEYPSNEHRRFAP